MKKLICRIFGHRKVAWFKTAAGARSQHPFTDGIQCYRCGELLYVYGGNEKIILIPAGTTAPEPRE